MAINRRKSIAKIEAKKTELQDEIDRLQRELDDLDRLQDLVETDNDLAYDHWYAQWFVVEDDDNTHDGFLDARGALETS